MEKAQNIEPEEIKSIDLDTIISKYGSLNGNLNKVINFGEEDPEQVVISLIVCKGKDNLGNREFLLSDELMKVGVSFAQHKTRGYCTLIIACSKFQNIYDSDDYGFISSQKFNSKKEFPKKGQQDPYKNNKKNPNNVCHHQYNGKGSNSERSINNILTQHNASFVDGIFKKIEELDNYNNIGLDKRPDFLNKISIRLHNQIIEKEKAIGLEESSVFND